MGGIRLGYPDFSRSGADSGSAALTSDVPLISTRHDADSKSSFIGTTDVPIISVVHDSKNAEVNGKADPINIRVVADTDSGEMSGKADKTRTRIVQDAINGDMQAKSDIPTIETIHDSVTGAGQGLSDIPTISTTHDATTGDATSKTGITNSISIAISQASESSMDGDAPDTDETWLAGLGGKVQLQDGTGVNGAEVQVIRDNDDTLVRSVETDSNGRWHVTLPAGTQPDPEVYVIEAYYRDGAKRDPDTDLFNATNRPYIDTADPSSDSPYDDDSQTSYTK